MKKGRAYGVSQRGTERSRDGVSKKRKKEKEK
jgi:hypothetical protein